MSKFSYVVLRKALSHIFNINRSIQKKKCFIFSHAIHPMKNYKSTCAMVRRFMYFLLISNNSLEMILE